MPWGYEKRYWKNTLRNWDFWDEKYICFWAKNNEEITTITKGHSEGERERERSSTNENIEIEIILWITNSQSIGGKWELKWT